MPYELDGWPPADESSIAGAQMQGCLSSGADLGLLAGSLHASM